MIKNKIYLFIFLVVAFIIFESCKSHINYIETKKQGMAPKKYSRIFIIPEIFNEPEDIRENFSDHIIHEIISSLKKKQYLVVNIKNPISVKESKRTEPVDEFQWFFKSGNYTASKKTYQYDWEKTDYYLQIKIMDYQKGFSLDSDFLEMSIYIYKVEDKNLVYSVQYYGFYDSIKGKIQSDFLIDSSLKINSGYPTAQKNILKYTG